MIATVPHCTHVASPALGSVWRCPVAGRGHYVFVRVTVRHRKVVAVHYVGETS